MIKEGSVVRCIDARDTRHLKDRYLYVVSKVCYGGSFFIFGLKHK